MRNYKLGDIFVKKILSALLLVILIGMNCLLSACNLITINNQKYLAQTVASVGDIKISMEDLILGYNSFGYNYVDQYSLSEEEAVKRTLEDLINRELLYEKAKKEIGALSITKQNEVWQEVYDSINSQIKTYADEIIEIEELKVSKTSSEEETEVTKFSPYEKKIVRKTDENGKVVKTSSGEYEYVRVSEDEEETDTSLIEFVLEEYEIEGLAQRAYSKYLNNAKKSRDEYKNLKESEVFEKEKERIYKIYEKNKYLTIFQERYEQNMTIDFDKIVEKYVELVRNSAFKYSIDEDAYNSDMQENSNEVYYQPYGEKYIEVAHILLKYSDEQTSQISTLKTGFEAGEKDADKYESELAKIAANIKVSNRLNENEAQKTVSEVFSEVTTAINSVSNDKKVSEFIKFVEKYNQDDGMLKAINSQTQYYAVNLDTSITDTMVEEFANAARSLENSENYTICAEPILTEYGYHIIMKIRNVDSISLENVENVSIDYLYETEAMEGTNKSLFDKMVELVDSSTYEEYQTSLISQLREGKEIRYYQSAYERLYK